MVRSNANQKINFRSIAQYVFLVPGNSSDVHFSEFFYPQFNLLREHPELFKDRKYVGGLTLTSLKMLFMFCIGQYVNTKCVISQKQIDLIYIFHI